ncbi:MAG: COG1361 S-layer family protein [Lachnospiraceae bacterium]
MKKITCLIGLLCILFMSTKVEAATPRVMVSDYNVKGGQVVSGEEFDLNITIKNESANSVKNIKVTISTENGELLPVQGAGTAYIKEIKGGEEQEVSFPMAAAYGLEEKSYKLAIKTEYEGGGIGYSVDEAVFIPVSLKQRLSVTDIYTAENSYEVGDTVEISAVVNNLGSGSLYNVSAKIVGDNLSDGETYVGNIEPGKSGTIDLLTKADRVSEGNYIKNQMIVYYEDKAGNQYENEIALNDIKVSAVIYDNFEVVKESKDFKGIGKTIVWILVVIFFVAALVYFLVKRRKKKQAYLDEF